MITQGDACYGKAPQISPPSIKYSGTSDSGPSEIGTLYNKPLYKGHCLRSQKLHAL